MAETKCVPKKRRWLPRPRFSLQTLLLGVLLVSSGYGLWFRWAPWVHMRELSTIIGGGCYRGLSFEYFPAVSKDNSKVLTVPAWKEKL